jgi:hypothetical protein
VTALIELEAIGRNERNCRFGSRRASSNAGNVTVEIGSPSLCAGLCRKSGMRPNRRRFHAHDSLGSLVQCVRPCVAREEGLLCS